jgi:rhodanese-related sulfurtransferase
MYTFLIIVVVLLVVYFLVTNLSSGGKIKEEGMSQINLQNSLLVDVREPDEFALGHNPNSINIPLSEIEKGRLSEFQNTDKENIVLVCRSGNRAGMVENILKQKGVSKNIVNLGPWQNLEKVK